MKPTGVIFLRNTFIDSNLDFLCNSPNLLLALCKFLSPISRKPQRITVRA